MPYSSPATSQWDAQRRGEPAYQENGQTFYTSPTATAANAGGKPPPAPAPAPTYAPAAMAQWPGPHAADPNFDQSKPGAAEAAYAQHGQDFYAPSAMGQLWGSVSGMDPSAPSQAGQYWQSVAGQQNTPTATSGAYADFRSSTPANLAPAYDRAETATAGAINDQLAARGLHGSSYGVGLIGSKIADMEAQRVKDEAQYGLQRAQLGGSLASAADQGALAKTLGFGQLAQTAGSGDLSRLGLLAGVAGGADSQRLASLTAGQSAANVAQGAKRTRTQDYFGNVFQPSAMMSAQAGGEYDRLLSDDQQALEQELAIKLGLPAANIAESDRAKQTLYQNWDDFDRVYKSIMSQGQSVGSHNNDGGGGGGGGGDGSSMVSGLGGFFNSKTGMGAG